MNVISTLLMPVSISFLLAGCGSEDLFLTSTKTEVVSGKVVDGYIKGAIVCVDENNNNLCDAGEAQDKTDWQGNFDIALLKGHKDIVKLISVGGVDIDTNKRVNATYTLLESTEKLIASEGRVVMSPISTAIQEITSEQLDKDSTFDDMVEARKEAVESISEWLDVDSEFLEVDPVQLSSDGDESLQKKNVLLEQFTELRRLNGDFYTKNLYSEVLKSTKKLIVSTAQSETTLHEIVNNPPQDEMIEDIRLTNLEDGSQCYEKFFRPMGEIESLRGFGILAEIQEQGRTATKLAIIGNQIRRVAEAFSGGLAQTIVRELISVKLKDENGVLIKSQDDLLAGYVGDAISSLSQSDNPESRIAGVNLSNLNIQLQKFTQVILLHKGLRDSVKNLGDNIASGAISKTIATTGVINKTVDMFSLIEESSNGFAALENGSLEVTATMSREIEKEARESSNIEKIVLEAVPLLMPILDKVVADCRELGLSVEEYNKRLTEAASSMLSNSEVKNSLKIRIASSLTSDKINKHLSSNVDSEFMLELIGSKIVDDIELINNIIKLTQNIQELTSKFSVVGEPKPQVVRSCVSKPTVNVVQENTSYVEIEQESNSTLTTFYDVYYDNKERDSVIYTKTEDINESKMCFSYVAKNISSVGDISPASRATYKRTSGSLFELTNEKCDARCAESPFEDFRHSIEIDSSSMEAVMTMTAIEDANNTKRASPIIKVFNEELEKWEDSPYFEISDDISEESGVSKYEIKLIYISEETASKRYKIFIKYPDCTSYFGSREIVFDYIPTFKKTEAAPFQMTGVTESDNVLYGSVYNGAYWSGRTYGHIAGYRYGISDNKVISLNNDTSIIDLIKKDEEVFIEHLYQVSDSEIAYLIKPFDSPSYLLKCDSSKNACEKPEYTSSIIGSSMESEYKKYMTSKLIGFSSDEKPDISNDENPISANPMSYLFSSEGYDFFIKRHQSNWSKEYNYASTLYVYKNSKFYGVVDLGNSLEAKALEKKNRLQYSGIEDIFVDEDGELNYFLIGTEFGWSKSKDAVFVKSRINTEEGKILFNKITKDTIISKSFDKRSDAIHITAKKCEEELMMSLGDTLFRIDKDGSVEVVYKDKPFARLEKYENCYLKFASDASTHKVDRIMKISK